MINTFLEGSVRPPAEYLKSSGGGHIPRLDIFFASLFPHLEHFLLGLVPLFIQFYICYINSGIVSDRKNKKAPKTFLIENTDGSYSLVPNFWVTTFPVPNFLKLSFRFVYHVHLLVLCTKNYCSLAFIGIINFNNYDDYDGDDDDDVDDNDNDDDDDDHKSLSQYTIGR